MHTMVSQQELQTLRERVHALLDERAHTMQLLAVLILTSPGQRLVVPTDNLTTWPLAPWRIRRTVEDGRVVLTMETDNED